MDKINLKKDNDAAINVQHGQTAQAPNEVKVDEATLFEDASPEMLKEANKREQSFKEAKKWTFLRYLKEIHTSPVKTLQDEYLPGARYSIGHILLSGLLCTGINMAISPIGQGIEEAGLLQVLAVMSYVSFMSILLVYGALLLNNLLLGSFIYVFGKSLSIKNEKGDYKTFLRNLFPITAVVSTFQYLLLPLLSSTSNTQTHMAINLAVSCLPALISYCLLRTVAWRGLFVYIVLSAWFSLFYFLLADKMGF